MKDEERYVNLIKNKDPQKWWKWETTNTTISTTHALDTSYFDVMTAILNAGMAGYEDRGITTPEIIRWMGIEKQQDELIEKVDSMIETMREARYTIYYKDEVLVDEPILSLEEHWGPDADDPDGYYQRYWVLKKYPENIKESIATNQMIDVPAGTTVSEFWGAYKNSGSSWDLQAYFTGR